MHRPRPRPSKNDPFSGKGQRLWKKAKKLIPGGGQLLSSRAELYLPEHWPAYYSKAKGVYIWDLDGRKYIDMCSVGVGACALGYCDPDVNRAVIAAVKQSSIGTLNSPHEVELAELLCTIHPWADMARFAKTGGEAMAIAARIARAYTGRDRIAFCGYHGWSDWYLATNLKDSKGLNDHLLSGLEPRGVPKGLTGTVVPFRYNKIDELKRIVKDAKGKLAAIIMEPVHSVKPKKGFLEEVRAIATKIGAVLIFDEITIGWKMIHGGAHLVYGVTPDIAVFAKAMSNGFPMAAIIGTRKVMQAAQGSFISSTYWIERIGQVAALATIRKMRRVNLPRHLLRVSNKVRSIWKDSAEKHGLSIQIAEVPVILTFTLTGSDSQEAKTLFVQEMLRRGFLASNLFYASYAHKDSHLAKYSKAVDDVFGIIAKARMSGGVKKLLKGPVAHAKFERLN